MSLQLRRNLLIILLVATVLFIWGNSCLSRAQSTKISDFVMNLLHIERDSAGTQVRPVRKAGHFTEFFALGGEFLLLFSLEKLSSRRRGLLLAFCGMFFPLVDETIQMFNDRSPEVRDVWIDIFGFSLGCLVAFLLLLLFRRIARKPKRSSPPAVSP